MRSTTAFRELPYICRKLVLMGSATALEPAPHSEKTHGVVDPIKQRCVVGLLRLTPFTGD